MFHTSVSLTACCSAVLWCLTDILTSAEHNANILLGASRHDVMWGQTEAQGSEQSVTVFYRWAKKLQGGERTKERAVLRERGYVCVSCSLVTQCVKPRTSGIIKYPFGTDSTVDATVSLETGSTNIHNIRISLPSSFIMTVAMATKLMIPHWALDYTHIHTQSGSIILMACRSVIGN